MGPFFFRSIPLNLIDRDLLDPMGTRKGQEKDETRTYRSWPDY